MSRRIIVLGAGIVGVSVAYQLVQRGHEVSLIDRREPGRETSFGNAGIIQREAVEPHAFPSDVRIVLRVLGNRGADIRYRPAGVAASARALLHYWRNSQSRRYRRIVPEYASLIALSTRSHGPMIERAGVQELVSTTGWLEVYRSRGSLDRRAERVRAVHAHHGVEFALLDRSELMQLEPRLSDAVVGGIHWRNSWTVADPGALVSAYAGLFELDGGHLLRAELTDLKPSTGGWEVRTDQGRLDASDVVMALGPWSKDWTDYLGYRLPLFPLRGYHMHYASEEGRPLHHWVMDADVGYIVEPMRAGIRLTTGAEVERRQAPPHHGQLDAAEAAARDLLPALGPRMDATPWLGARPCSGDMKPVIGPAPRHDGLWFAFGHGHQGFTLGPATAWLLDSMIAGEAPVIDPQPFSPARFD